VAAGDDKRPFEHGRINDESRRNIEWLKCSRSPAYFINQYCQIYNASERAWIRFDLWPPQMATLQTIADHRLVIILKARQLGLSWLCIGYVLWMMLFRPAATSLIFSKRDEEAIELLDFRLKGSYQRLPIWMQARMVTLDAKHDWHLSNGSMGKAFPTTGGRSYTGSIALVDEADFVQDLDLLLNAVKPTIDAGGQMLLISTVDKARPESAFKRIYRAAFAGSTEWTPIFLPWHTRPGRDAAWYAEQKADILARTGSLDDLHQEYPESPTQALSPRTLDKRIPAPWIEACYQPGQSIDDPDAPAMDQLVIFQPPQKEHIYVIGIDPAEGNPTSDDSALTVLDVMTGEEVVCLSGKYEPDVMAAHADAVGVYYNQAGLMPERNNHGHAVISWLKQNSRLRLLHGHDDKEGWLSSSLGKALLYNEMANAFRNQETTLHSFATYTQLASIEGRTLRAPEGQHDDRADSYALAHVGRLAMIRAAAGISDTELAGQFGYL
jgi:hypothetical protein